MGSLSSSRSCCFEASPLSFANALMVAESGQLDASVLANFWLIEADSFLVVLFFACETTAIVPMRAHLTRMASQLCDSAARLPSRCPPGRSVSCTQRVGHVRRVIRITHPPSAPLPRNATQVPCLVLAGLQHTRHSQSPRFRIHLTRLRIFGPWGGRQCGVIDAQFK